MKARTVTVMAMLALTAACTAGDSATTTIPSTSTSSIVAASTTLEPTTSSGVSTTTTTTIPPLPTEPAVTAGWALRRRDLLVANQEGVHIVRDGVVVARPVTSPVEAAISDGAGAIVFVTPLEDLYPGAWPDPDRGGGFVIWKAYSDGVVQSVLHTGPVVIDGAYGPITLYQAVLIPEFGDLTRPKVMFSTADTRPEDPPFTNDRVNILMMTGNTLGWGIHPREFGGTGVSGAGWLAREELLVVVARDADASWLAAVGFPSQDGWPANPIPEGTPCADDPAVFDCLGTVTTFLLNSWIACTITDAAKTVTDLVVIDLDTGDEIERVRVAETPVVVKQIHAFNNRVVVSLLMRDGEGYHHLPAVMIDIGSDQIETVPVPGVATIVP